MSNLKECLLKSIKNNKYQNDKTFNLQLALIEQGDDSALYHLGEYFENLKDYENMNKCYLLAARNNNMKAIFKLADNDNVDAIFKLALYYEDQNDHEKVKIYYERAIKKGDKDAMYNYGLYYESQGDYEKMIKYHKMAEENGSAEAMNSLGVYYNEQQDYNKMFKYYSKAIDKGYVLAMYNMAAYYHTKKDFHNMLKYYNMASENGHIFSSICLGIYYEDCNDYKIAKKYYKKAIKNGCKEGNKLNKYLKLVDEDDIKDIEYLYKYELTEYLYTLENKIIDIYSKLTNISPIDKKIFYKIYQVRESNQYRRIHDIEQINIPKEDELFRKLRIFYITPYDFLSNQDKEFIIKKDAFDKIQKIKDKLSKNTWQVVSQDNIMYDCTFIFKELKE